MSVNSITPNGTAILDETPVNAQGMIHLSFVFMSVAIIAVSLRLYCRYFLTKKVWWDDGVIVFALLVSIALTVDSYYAEKFGWGHHSEDIPPVPGIIIGVLKTLLISQMMLTLAAGLTKCSILFFYIRITSGGAHPTLRHIIIVSLVLIACYTVAMTMVICVQCIPLSNFWSILEYDTRAASCAPWSGKWSFFLGQGVSNTIGDFLVVLLPLKQILSLRLPIRQKSVVVVLFMLGILASIAGTLRIYYIAQTFETPDNTWNGCITFGLGCLEVNTGIICASIPAIKPLIVLWFPCYNSSGSPQRPMASFRKSSKFSSKAESASVVIDMTIREVTKDTLVGV